MSPYSPIPQVVSIPGPQRRGTGGTPSSSFGKATGTGGTRPESDRPPSGRPLLLRKSAAGSVAPTGLFGSLGVVPRTSCWANFLAADPAQAKLGRGTPQSFPGHRRLFSSVAEARGSGGGDGAVGIMRGQMADQRAGVRRARIRDRK